MQTIRLWIKQTFPALYETLRTQLFPLAAKWRKKKAQNFTSICIKPVSIHGHTFKIELNPKNGFVDRTIFTTGVYEPDILKTIKTHLPLGGVFIDVGANIGQHSLFAACCVGETGKVTAFEPLPFIAEQNERSIKLNDFSDRITLHTIGCSDHEHTADIQVNSQNVGGSSLHTSDVSHAQISISLTTADTYLSNEKRVDFIKIDTEGHELETLTGLAQTISQFSPTLLLELSPSLYKDRNKVAEQIFDLLDTHGYKYYDIENGLQEISDNRNWLSGFNKLQTNLLCTQE
jgi:FkbM family methyltransferase